MKKFFKGFVACFFAFVCMISFAACGKKVSATTVDTSKVLVTNGKSTNGGMTLVHNGYLYFINGSKTNDGTSSKNNTISAIYRVKYDTSTGKITDSTYEKLVDSLVGFDYGSINIFGDYLYYTTPSADVNSKDEVLYKKTKFMRYDLVNKKSYEIYTTNSKDESSISYAYYVVGSSLNLVVYEQDNKTITSLKIDKKVTTNYELTNISGCLFSENNGVSEVSGQTDANNFVYFTQSYSEYTEQYRDGVKVFRVSPTSKDTIHCLSNEGKSVSLLTIRNGKLFYALKSDITGESIVYNQKITGSASETLAFGDNEFNYIAYSDEIFIENEDGTVSLLYLDSESYELWMMEYDTAGNKTQKRLNQFTKPSSSSSSSDDTFAMIGLTTINEIIIEDDPATEEINEEKRADITYLVVMDTNLIYKVEIARTVDGTKTLSENADIIQLSKTSFIMPTSSSLLVPEIIDNYVYALAKELDDNDKETGNTYLYRVDLSVNETTKTLATLVGVEED